ncbi:MAG: signal recognition particle receptor subunit alpha [Chloroflexi bacterium]|nr:signal recognition particle receptor subunit alpha [Chloroflexota bacterium]
MFDALSSSLRASLRRLTGSGRISAADLDAGLADIRASLLGADVAAPVAARLLDQIRERAQRSEIVGGLGAGERMLGILHDVLTEVLGGSGRELDLRERPATILLFGLQGAGKTTTAAKLALRLMKEGRRPMLVAADPRRPAAAEQLGILAAGIKVPMHREPVGTPVSEIGTRAIAAARRLGLDVVIIDSAGRTALDDELLEELRELRSVTKPRERLLVVDAAVGQTALAIAQGFSGAAEPTGLILSKLDGDARGGAAISIAGGAGIPVVYVGTGERSEALERFHPDRIANRILGMGDLATLAERVREAEIGPGADPSAEARTKAAEARALRGGMTFDDLLSQLRQMSSLGPIGQVVKMIPGMGGMAEQAEAAVASGELKRTEAMILSMTPDERRDPAVISLPRRRRIAAGAGRTVEEVNRLVKRLEEMRLVMRRAGGGDPRRLMAGGAGLPGKHAGGRIPAKAAKREKRAKKGRKRR